MAMRTEIWGNSGRMSDARPFEVYWLRIGIADGLPVNEWYRCAGARDHHLGMSFRTVRAIRPCISVPMSLHMPMHAICVQAVGDEDQ